MNKQVHTFVHNNYDAQGNMAFLPSELRKIRCYLINQNDLLSFMIWCIILVGTKLFARVDEVLVLKVEDFDNNQDFFIAKQHNIHSLAVDLKGKTGTRLHLDKLMLWDDKECPEFSPVWAILLWIQLSGIRSGYIFPSPEELQSSQKHTTEHYPYKHLLNAMKHLYFDVLNHDKEDPKYKNVMFGTHIFCKTMYFLAYLSHKRYGYRLDKIEEALMLQSSRRLCSPDQNDHSLITESARHSTNSSNCTTIMQYLWDSPVLAHAMDTEDFDSAQNKVGKWIPIVILSLRPLQQILVPVTAYQKPLPQMAARYMHDILLQPKSPLRHIHLPTLSDVSVNYAPDRELTHRLHGLLKDNLPPTVLPTVEALMREQTINAVSVSHNRLGADPHDAADFVDSYFQGSVIDSAMEKVSNHLDLSNTASRQVLKIVRRKIDQHRRKRQAQTQLVATPSLRQRTVDPTVEVAGPTIGQVVDSSSAVNGPVVTGPVVQRSISSLDAIEHLQKRMSRGGNSKQARLAKAKIAFDEGYPVLQRLAQQHPGSISSALSTKRRFVRRVAKTVECILDCHDGSVDLFVESNPLYSPASFCAKADSKCSHGLHHTGSLAILD